MEIALDVKYKVLTGVYSASPVKMEMSVEGISALTFGEYLMANKHHQKTSPLYHIISTSCKE